MFIHIYTFYAAKLLKFFELHKCLYTLYKTFLSTAYLLLILRLFSAR